MNPIIRLSILILGLLFVFSCQKEEVTAPDVAAPQNLTLNFDITQDNSGLVTIIPDAEGATMYRVDFGLIPYETPTDIPAGERITQVYPEGTYTVEVTAMGATGKTASISKELTVSFRPPENMVVTVEFDAVNPKITNISATADYVTLFDIYFGYDPDEEPKTVLPDEKATHTYEAPGDYTIRVVAKNASTETLEYTEVITIAEASDPVTLPIDFESFTVNYAFTDFGNVSSAVIDNPDQSGINTSDRVAQSVKPSNAEVWGGSFLTVGAPIDFSVKNTFKVKVWSPKADMLVKLKVENIDDGNIAYEVDVTTTTSSAWEELSFDFSAIDQGNTYQKVVIFFDFGNPGDDATYYFDDIVQVPSVIPPTSMIEDFEGEAPEFTNFGNAVSQVIDNPDQSGENTTSKVAEFTKPTGAEVWAGSFIDLPEALDLVNFSKVSMKTWSPKVNIAVRLKLENSANSEQFFELDAMTTVSGSWEELVYDVSAAESFPYDRVVVFFDFGTAGDDAVYYFDEIQLVNEGGGGVPPLVFEDFEGEAPEFTNFGNAVSVVIPNPDASGINMSATVAEFTKPSGSEVWAGSFIDLGSPLDLNTYSKIAVKAWSPKAGIAVRVKLENSQNSSEFFELDATTSTSNSWEELTYDMSEAPSFNYDRFVIFFDFGVNGDDSIYYFDDLTLTN